MRELLFSITKKDFKITWFSGTGAGGQHRNKHQNCCRIIHPESGASATGQDQRSRGQNQKTAFSRLVKGEIFQKWLRLKIAQTELNQDNIEKIVSEMMQPENLKIEDHCQKCGNHRVNERCLCENNNKK